VSSPPGTTLSSLMRERLGPPPDVASPALASRRSPWFSRGPLLAWRPLGSCVSGAAAWGPGSIVLWVCVPPAGLSPAPAADVRDSRGVACNCKLLLT
jgi:hypothetical protein